MCLEHFPGCRRYKDTHFRNHNKPVFQFQNIQPLQTEKMKQMESTFNTQLRDLKKKLNYLMHMVQGRSSGASLIQNTLEEDQLSPKAISSEQELTDMEQNLIEYDRNPLISSEFSIKRERMVEHYAGKIKNISKRTNPKIGLVGSLLNLYFAPEFLNTIGWTNVQGKIIITFRAIYAIRGWFLGIPGVC